MYSTTFNPVKLLPLDDEVLSSWIIRNSIANGSDPSSWAGAIWPNWRAWTRDLDRMLPSSQLKILSKSSGINIPILRSMTLEPVIERVLNTNTLNNKKAWKWVIPTGGRNKTKINGLHFCPLCIAIKPSYFRRSWRLSWNIACPEHKLLLLSKCTCCNMSISPHLVSYLKTDITRCVSCDFQLSTSTRLPVHPDALWLQILLTRSLEERNNIAFPLKINKSTELFDAVQFLMVFFQNSLKNLKPYKSLHKALKLDHMETHHSPSSGIRIEARIYLERHFLMIATARLLKLSLSEVISLFINIGITQQMFMIGKTGSNVISEINDALPDNSRLKYTSPEPRTIIKARSKKEVETLMAEILPYL